MEETGGESNRETIVILKYFATDVWGNGLCEKEKHYEQRKLFLRPGKK